MILVTGASGFLGAALVKQLVADGKSVRIIKRTNSSIAYLKDIVTKIDVREADILDVPALEEAFIGIEEIYHCAAVVAYDKKNFELMYKANIEGTANIVNVALGSGIKKIVYVSSIAAIGGKPEEIITEETKWEDNQWNTDYGITKQMAERQIFRGIEEGLTAVIINPGIIVGIGHDESKSTLRFLKKISAQKMPFYTNGTNGFVDIDDVVRLCILLMEGSFNNEKFIAVSENWSFKQYFESIAKEFGVKPPTMRLIPLTAKLFYILDAIATFFMPSRKRGYTKQNAKISLEKFNYSNQKIKEVLNYKFIPMEETVRKIVKSYQDGNK